MMEFTNPDAQIYVPDGTDPLQAIARTSHLAIGAHPDDIAIMAYDGILRCFGRTDEWFLGITVTDGAGSPRSGPYGEFTNDEMRQVRVTEEKKAAFVGEYSAVVLLGYSSTAAKDPANKRVVAELAALIEQARPSVVYTHNPADAHDTHVAVALRTIEAIRTLSPEARPEAVYGCEVWRDLDWMTAADKVVFDVSDRSNLAAAVIGVYDSQISGGKRYDLAAAGRRLSHATYAESHAVDEAGALIYAMNLQPLTETEDSDPASYVLEHVERMRNETEDRIRRLM